MDARDSYLKALSGAWGLNSKISGPTTLRSSMLQEAEASRREHILGAALEKNDWRRQVQGTPHRALSMAAVVG